MNKKFILFLGVIVFNSGFLFCDEARDRNLYNPVRHMSESST
jgi:hypothetical protein